MSEGVQCPHNSTLPTKTEGVKAHVSNAFYPFGFMSPDVVNLLGSSLAWIAVPVVLLLSQKVIWSVSDV